MLVTEFSFEMGEREKHTIAFRYVRWTGSVQAQCDGAEIWRDRVFFRFQTPTLYATIGREEIHELRIDLLRPTFFGNRTVLVHVDNVLVGEY
jgi:hypothetical protein